MIDPVSHGFAYVNRINDIVPIAGDSGGYYQTKSGRQVGFDSLYIFDMATDCESEGFIRFRNNKTDQTGMFNAEGRVVIPAVYNVLTKVTNGLVVALRNAEKEYWDSDHEHSGCNHYSWKGGEILLIDTNNRILINNFDYPDSLDFYSLEISAVSGNDVNRKYFSAVDGTFYSFAMFDKMFETWLRDSLLNNLTECDIRKICFDQVIFSNRGREQITESPEDFVNKNRESVKRVLSKIKTSGYTIEKDDLNIYTFDPEEYGAYYDNCYQPNDRKYPVFDVIISGNTYSKSSDCISFLKTDTGYKLVYFSVTSEELR
jgi:hypothetical protein